MRKDFDWRLPLVLAISVIVAPIVIVVGIYSWLRQGVLFVRRVIVG